MIAGCIILIADRFFFGFTPIRSIAALGPDDIWISAGTPQHYDGVRWTEHRGIQQAGTAYKIGRTNSSNLWFVGSGGAIVWYNAGTWQRVESGVTMTLNDVWGGSNRWIGDDIVLIAASEKYTFSEKRILRVQSSGAIDTLSWPMQDQPIHSIWFNSHSNLYACGSSVFVRKGTNWKRFTTLPSIYTDCIRGNAENDIWAVGDFGITAHFNGVTWRVYPIAFSNGLLYSVSVKGDRMIAVGEISGGLGTRAIVVKGQRN